jgi:hypothetical protein
MVLTVNFSCITDQVSNDQRGTKQVTKSRYGIVTYWCETLPVGLISNTVFIGMIRLSAEVRQGCRDGSVLSRGGTEAAEG